MKFPRTISEQLAYCTVRLEGLEKDGTTTGIGTGFFFNYSDRGSRTIPLVVTCRHVVEDSNDETFVRSDEKLSELSAVEEVLMVGYPIGLWDSANNFPLMRRGITAVHPSLDFQGSPDGVVDVACFPGSSGSPICIVNEAGYREKGTTVIGGQRWIFLGALHSGPVLEADGNIAIRKIPTHTEDYVCSEQMIHLGYYVKSKEVLTLAKHIWDELVKKTGGSP